MHDFSIKLVALVFSVLFVAGYRPAFAQSTLAEVKATFGRPQDPVSLPDRQIASIEIGRTLFFDTGLSSSGTMSCGTCHEPDGFWKDGRARAIDNHGLPMGRRAPTLSNIGWQPTLLWDGRMTSLEQQATDPIFHPRMGAMNRDAIVARIDHLLAGDPALAVRYQTAFGTRDVSLVDVSQAIADFERSLVSPPAAFDRWIDGDRNAISPAAQRGFALFNGRANCAVCHEGWRFTDDGFHDIGLPDADLGRGVQAPNEPTLQHAFKTPTLRGISRGPYMHDGSIATLDAVLEHYSGHFSNRPSLDPEIRTLDLSKADRADLVAFLLSLDALPPPPSSQGNPP